MAWSALEVIHTVCKHLLLVFVLRCVLVYGYRFTLHPLSRFPGPIVAATTDWYVAIYALLKRQHLATYLDHQKYGPVIRHGPNKLVFNSARALRDIYQSERTNKVSSYLCTQIKPDTFSIFNCLDKNLHRIKRRMISKALSEQKMRRFEPILLTHIDTFLKLLLTASRAGETTNMSDRCKRLGLEIIGKFGFGYDLNLQTEETNTFVLKGLEGSSYRNNVYIQAPSVQWMGVEFMFPALFKLRMKYYFWLKKVVKQRLAEGKDAKEDLFKYVIDAKDPETGTKIRMSELWSETTFFFPTGGDTTATTLAATFFYLSRNPNYYSRLTSEVRSKFSSGAEIQSGSLLSSCICLRAILDETMRMSPAISGTLWRELPVGDSDSSKPLIIDGHIVPAGTWVGVNTYTIHHNEEYFPEPFVFKPERWLADDDSGKSNLKHMQEAFVPFGLGSRSCAGKNMAYMEASLVLAKTVWYFDFERSQDTKLDKVGGGKRGSTIGRGHSDEFQLQDQFIASHDGP